MDLFTQLDSFAKVYARRQKSVRKGGGGVKPKIYLKPKFLSFYSRN